MLTPLKWTVVALQFVTTLQQSDNLVELTDSSFDELVFNSDKSWLVNFYSPQCGFCLIFEPDWAEASRILANTTDKVKLGSLDITVHVVKRTEHRIPFTPSIRYFPPGSKSPRDAEEYRKSRRPQALVAFVRGKLALLPKENINMFKNGTEVPGTGNSSTKNGTEEPTTENSSAKIGSEEPSK